MSEENRYDYIIAGMGCAGLSLAMQLKRSDLPFKRVLLIDKDLKTKNDRTWCFWTKEKNTWYDEIICKRWLKFKFKSKGYDQDFVLQPYEYQMVRGIDFYEYCLNELKQDERFHILTAPIKELLTLNSMAVLKTQEYSYFAPYIFNSAFRIQSLKTNHINYVQHFKGWLIETPDEQFNDSCPVFMNFDTEQFRDCRFFYVIPFTKQKALIEYTGFSKNALNEEEYDQALMHYIKEDLRISNFNILETERGEIPMAESRFINPYGSAIINIGTAGGYSKPSTGYTFYFIQKNTKHIISQLKKGAKVLSPATRTWHAELYDKILLDVLNKKEIEAREVFTLLFKKNRITRLLAFLNEESTLLEDLSILNSVPKKPFIISAIKKLFS